MEVWKKMEEFEEVSSEYQKIGSYIRKQDPFRYQEEYGTDFIHYTDENLMDMFICKFGHYKPSVMSVVFGKYRKFYQWCVNRHEIAWNPFENSKYLSYEYLVRMAAANGNVPYYSRDYVVKLCEEQTGCPEYYKAIALSLFEGVKSYAQLARLKWTDVDRERRRLVLKECELKISEELLDSYEKLHRDTYFQAREARLAFDLQSEALILPLVRHGQEHSLCERNYRYLSNAISRKMTALGLSASGLYESGLIHRLVETFGKEAIFTYLLPENPLSKKEINQKNRELETFFKESGSSISAKDFAFDFKGYGLLLKYGGGKEK